MIPSASFVATALLLGGLAVNAAHIEFRRIPTKVPTRPEIGDWISRRSSQPARRQEQEEEEEEEDVNADESADIAAFMEDTYTVPITLGGKEYKMVLDTAHADIWVDTAPEASENWDVDVTLRYDYSLGYLDVSGKVYSAPAKIGSYEVPEQAFVDIDDAQGKFLEGTGVDGIFGIGIGSPESGIRSAVLEQEPDAEWAGSFLENMFEQGAQRYVVLSFNRSADHTMLEGGDVNIGETPAGAEAVTTAQKTPLYPPGTKEWTIQLDYIKVEGKTVKVNPQHKSGQSSAVARISTDIALPKGYVPPETVDAIYSNVPGAAKYTDSASNTTTWIVPCTHPVNLAYSFGGIENQIHPLEVTEYWTEAPELLKSYSVCKGSIQGHVKPDANHDVLLGMSFMSSAYTMFNYDEKNPSVQFLSRVDSKTATDQFNKVRGKSNGNLKEVEPALVVDMLEAQASPTHHKHHTKSSSADGSSATGSRSSKSREGTSSGSGAAAAAADGAESTSDGSLKKYMPVILGLLGGNLVVGLVLIGLAILNYVKRGAQAKRSPGSPHYVPVMKDGGDNTQVLFDSTEGKRYGS